MNKTILTSTLIILILSACTQSLADVTPIPPPATLTPTLSFDTPVSPVTTPGAGTLVVPLATFSGGTGAYAVILIPADDALNIRARPGAENPSTGTLQPGAANVTRTGAESMLGEDLWVEIQNPGGGTGWVNAEFLTEYVVPSAFCGDARVTTLLNRFESAVKTSDGEAFMSLVSPAHGLDVVYIRDGMVANYTPEEAGWAFQSAYEVDWGPGAGSGEPVSGTFSEIITPALQDVFTNVTFACNEIKLGGASYPVEWPGEYANINFYSLHKPGTEPFGGLDWRTWLAGVEYVGGEPYLFVLLNYQWEP